MVRRLLMVAAVPAVAVAVTLFAATPSLARDGRGGGGGGRGVSGSRGGGGGGWGRGDWDRGRGFGRGGYYPGWGFYGWGYGRPWVGGYYGYGYSPDYYYGAGYTYDYGAYNPGTPDYYSQQATAEGGERDAALIDVKVPSDAEVWFNGVRTQQRGSDREFESPPLQPDRRYSYDIRARWREDGRTVDRTKTIRVAPGERRTVNFMASSRDEEDRDDRALDRGERGRSREGYRGGDRDEDSRRRDSSSGSRRPIP